MKKKLLCLVLLGVCTLSACSFPKQNTSNSDNTNVPSEKIPDTYTEQLDPHSTTEGENKSDLTTLLDEINKNVQASTAGSSLKAVPVTVKLLDWGVSTNMTTDEIKKEVTDWTSSKTSDELIEFSEQMSVVFGDYKDLLGENAQGLLDSAGYTDAAYPWSDKPIETIETIFNTLGIQ